MFKGSIFPCYISLPECNLICVEAVPFVSTNTRDLFFGDLTPTPPVTGEHLGQFPTHKSQEQPIDTTSPCSVSPGDSLLAKLCVFAAIDAVRID